MSQTIRHAEAHRPRLERGKLIVILLLSTAIIGGATWALTNPGRNLVNQATTKQPERFTELSFEDPQHLPKTVAAGQPASFKYRIVNHEAADVTYHTRITIVENGRLRVLEQSRVLVPNGGNTTLSVSFATAKSDTSLELIVDLIDQGESLHFRSRS